MFLDAHCHLERGKKHPLYPDLDAVVERMRCARVKAVNTGHNIEANHRVLEACADYQNDFFAAIGTSPHDAGSCKLDDELAYVRRNARRIIAIGEIGLDYHYFKKDAERKRQQAVFEAMLALAEELGKPVVVHSREAEREVAETLKSFKVKVLLHCLQKPEAAKWMPEGCWFSLPTLKNDCRVKLIETVPFERLLAETDSPFLWRGGRNEPANVAEVYETVAQAKGLGVGEVEGAFWRNAGELFSWRA
ncbi:hypothetical protein COU39_00105 [Candidatus Micrarchaeota archaeon CG10_big_fil_rev_8_21_14_0_10_60_32]|nr:MAG: hypothetical protein COU39_00105 [Candidatus Micrarchaeota archaeon CG10_big_fil_rev_8_21_14_0_10_60_32]PIO01818.1 MAG: hypothetical protein COT58_03255 [Candidatus Micrarchaeota archaeon CG09_land_8_20_14_0_10_60_16]